MAVIIGKPSRTRDWKKAVEVLALAALSLPSLSPAGLFRTIREAIEASEPSQSTDNRAWIWLRVSLTAAILDFLNDGTPAPLDAEERQETARALFEEALVLRGVEQVEAAMLVNPGAAAVLAPLVERVAALAADPEDARRTFARTLRRVSARVYALDVDFYRPVAEAVLGPFAEGERRDFAWARHEDWIRGLLEREPILSIDAGETRSLASVYHRLRCFWHDAHPDAGTGRTAHVGDLHGTLRHWLGDPGADQIRVVAGGPGSGKSSFSRAFATEVIEAGHWRVLYVELRHFGPGDTLFTRIGDYLMERNTAVDPRGSAGFPENPLDWRAEDPTPLLILFDGLDEISGDDDKARDLARKFLFALRNLLTRLNASGPRVRALVTGRAAACQDALREADLAPDALIHVAPLTPLDHAWGPVLRVEDPFGLAARDERPDFWRRSTRDSSAPVPEAVQARSLRDLNAEPLLLHLLMLSGYMGENWPLVARNRNIVYEAILTRIFEHNRNKSHIAAQGLDREDFFTLLECLGLAAWRGTGATGSEAGFARIRDLRSSPAQRRKFETLSAADPRNVVLQVHARRDPDGVGYEFIHKSFGEYLTARGLLAFGLGSADWIEDARHPPTFEEAARRWVEVTGKAELSEDIIRFLRDEGRGLSAVVARTALDTLTGLFNWCLREGMPAHRLAPDLGFREIERMQRCAETVLLAVMDALGRQARAGQVSGLSEEGTMPVRWPDTHMPQAELLNRIKATVGHPSRLVTGCLDFSGADLSYLFLSGISFAGTNLRGANLFRAELDGADLSGADLSGANLRGANLSRCDLSRANLTGARLLSCGMDGARLRDALLVGASLTAVSLNGADLKGADLTGCELCDTDLDGALNLTRPRIEGTRASPGSTRPAPPDCPSGGAE